MDVGCDSVFMVPGMDCVGKAIKKTNWWINISIKQYLVMNNAGAQGTNGTIKEYQPKLIDKYNIDIIFQVSRSTYTNLLNLGA